MNEGIAGTDRRVRLAYLVSHPIQYQAPLLRRIAQEPDIDLLVLFGSHFSVRSHHDEGFGMTFAWDIPLLEGYQSRLLPAWRDPGTVSATTPWSRGLLRALCAADGSPAFDALWVHGYASLNSLGAMLAAKALGIPVLLRAESWLADRPRTWRTLLGKRAFFAALRPLVSGVLPIGSQNAQYWRQYLRAGVPQFAMPYAVDNAFFAEQTSLAEARLPALRAELDLVPGRPVILFASKLQARKHADDLLAAFSKLCERGSCYAPPYLVVVGDGPERAALEAQARALNLTAAVRFAGFRNQTELPGFFALAEVFVLPAQHEPWGLVVNEAMAAGRPVVVSSDVGAAADLVQDSVNGFVYPTGNLDALASALAAVLGSPTTAAAMGRAAAEHMRTWDFEADLAGLRRALASVTGKIRA